MVRVAVDGAPVLGRRAGDRVELEDGRAIPEAGASYLAPVEPSKITAVHLRYRSRVEEYGAALPVAPAPHR